MAEQIFESLAKRLLAGGVAPKHVTRVVSELRDHFTDLTTEAMHGGASPTDAEREALARLGSEDAIAEDILAKPELKSWAARWPWAVFTLGPIAIGLGVLSVFFFGIWAFISTWRNVFPAFGLSENSTLLIADIVASSEYVWAPVCVVAVCFYAIRRGVNWHWQATATLFVASIAFFFSGIDIIPNLPVPEAGPARGNLQLGFGYGSEAIEIFFALGTKFVPPLALMGCLQVFLPNPAHTKTQ